MKKWYHLVLTILTIAMLILVTFNKINNATHWVDLSDYQTIIDYIWQFGPMVLLCFFASMIIYYFLYCQLSLEDVYSSSFLFDCLKVLSKFIKF